MPGVKVSYFGQIKFKGFLSLEYAPNESTIKPQQKTNRNKELPNESTHCFNIT